MKIPVVNEQDEIIGYKERDDIAPGDIVRITNIWITDENGNILLSQRSFNKKNSPGKWSPAVAGTVEEGETYESNAYKEIKEEIGLDGVVLKPIEKILYTSATGSKFSQFYKVTIPNNTPLIIQKSEVAQIKWFSRDEFKAYLNDKPEDFVNSFQVLKKFYENL